MTSGDRDPCAKRCTGTGRGAGYAARRARTLDLLGRPPNVCERSSNDVGDRRLRQHEMPNRRERSGTSRRATRTRRTKAIWSRTTRSALAAARLRRWGTALSITRWTRGYTRTYQPKLDTVPTFCIPCNALAGDASSRPQPFENRDGGSRVPQAGSEDESGAGTIHHLGGGEGQRSCGCPG